MGLGSLISNDIGMITGFLQNRSAGQQQQKRDEEKKKENQTAQAFAVLGALQNNQMRQDRLSRDQSEMMAQMPELARQELVALQFLNSAQNGSGDEGQIARAAAQYEAAVAAHKAVKSRVGQLAGQIDLVEEQSNQLSDFLNKQTVLADVLQVKSMLQQSVQGAETMTPSQQAQETAGQTATAQPAQSPQQSQAAPGQQMAAPQGQAPGKPKGPVQPATAPAQSASRAQFWVNEAKSVGVKAEIGPDGQATAYADDDRQEIEINKKLSSIPGKTGMDPQITVVNKMAKMENKLAERKFSDQSVGDQAPAISAAMNRAGYQMTLGADQGGLTFVQEVDGEDADGNPTRSIQPGTFADETPEKLGNVANAISQTADAVGDNISGLSALNKLASTAITAVDRAVETGDARRVGNAYVINPFQGGGAPPEALADLANASLELKIRLQSAGIAPALDVRAPEPAEASQMFKDAWTKDEFSAAGSGLGGGLAAGKQARDLAAKLSADIKYLNTYVYDLDGKIPPEAAKDIREAFNAPKVKQILAKNPMLNRIWQQLSADLGK